MSVAMAVEVKPRMVVVKTVDSMLERAEARFGPEPAAMLAADLLRLTPALSGAAADSTTQCSSNKF